MKKIFYSILSYLLLTEMAFADNTGVLWDFKGSAEETEKALNNGNIHLDDIPNIIQSAINFFMGIAGTVAVIFVIIGAYQILFGSISQDKTKWRNTIIYALTGFALASLSWFIIRTIIDNLSTI